MGNDLSHEAFYILNIGNYFSMMKHYILNMGIDIFHEAFYILNIRNDLGKY